MASRLIPACAGTTAAEFLLRPGRGAHPRLRGDHPLNYRIGQFGHGSSPPARGPLCFLPPLQNFGSAHPRLRGDHLQKLSNGGHGGGSSPPARGPPRRSFCCVQGEGLIPACAGTTLRTPSRGLREGAHPRLRGDHAVWPADTPTIGGSSPPARGPLRSVRLAAFPSGLIPACAGTTRMIFDHEITTGAHPRLRGDHVFLPWCGVDAEGSSPPARGPPLGFSHASGSLGLIPACAGTTLSSPASDTGRSAHPRLRGDHCDAPEGS